MLYSHDTQGLGHIRRNLALASALVEGRDDTDVLLTTGAAAATSLPMPARTEALTLPRIAKDPDGRYSPAAFGLSLDEVVGLRRELIRTAGGRAQGRRARPTGVGQRALGSAPPRDRGGLHPRL